VSAVFKTVLTNFLKYPAVWGIMVAIDLGLMAIYATYDAAGKLNHGGYTPKPHGEHR
jgi:hypothetical protein